MMPPLTSEDLKFVEEMANDPSILNRQIAVLTKAIIQLTETVTLSGVGNRPRRSGMLAARRESPNLGRDRREPRERHTDAGMGDEPASSVLDERLEREPASSAASAMI